MTVNVRACYLAQPLLHNYALKLLLIYLVEQTANGMSHPAACFPLLYAFI